MRWSDLATGARFSGATNRPSEHQILLVGYYRHHRCRLQSSDTTRSVFSLPSLSLSIHNQFLSFFLFLFSLHASRASFFLYFRHTDVDRPRQSPSETLPRSLPSTKSPARTSFLCVSCPFVTTSTLLTQCAASTLSTHINMVSKTLMGVWAGLDFLLLASGAFALAMSIVWRAPNLLLNMVLSPGDLTGASQHL